MGKSQGRSRQKPTHISSAILQTLNQTERKPRKRQEPNSFHGRRRLHVPGLPGTTKVLYLYKPRKAFFIRYPNYGFPLGHLAKSMGLTENGEFTILEFTKPTILVASGLTKNSHVCKNVRFARRARAEENEELRHEPYIWNELIRALRENPALSCLEIPYGFSHAVCYPDELLIPSEISISPTDSGWIVERTNVVKILRAHMGISTKPTAPSISWASRNDRGKIKFSDLGGGDTLIERPHRVLIDPQTGVVVQIENPVTRTLLWSVYGLEVGKLAPKEALSRLPQGA